MESVVDEQTPAHCQANTHHTHDSKSDEKHLNDRGAFIRVLRDGLSGLLRSSWVFNSDAHPTGRPEICLMVQKLHVNCTEQKQGCEDEQIEVHVLNVL